MLEVRAVPEALRHLSAPSLRVRDAVLVVLQGPISLSTRQIGKPLDGYPAGPYLARRGDYRIGTCRGSLLRRASLRR